MQSAVLTFSKVLVTSQIYKVQQPYVKCVVMYYLNLLLLVIVRLVLYIVPEKKSPQREYSLGVNFRGRRKLTKIKKHGGTSCL